jgi:3-methyl-2-oxobutanoate hydroxymethyltransferase
MLGLNEEFAPRFLKRYAEMAEQVRLAVSQYASEVQSGAYPDDAHSFD